jgi:hypothetical protein
MSNVTSVSISRSHIRWMVLALLCTAAALCSACGSEETGASQVHDPADAGADALSDPSLDTTTDTPGNRDQGRDALPDTGLDSTTDAAEPDDADTTVEEDAPRPTGCGNESIYLQLKPTCEGCHAIGTFPAFESLLSFENLLLYNPRWVTPGNPDASLLLDLLRGQAPGTLSQMPPGVRSFQDLADDGETLISVEELADCITDLSDGTAVPSGDIRVTTRLTAEQIRAALFSQLDLTPRDFLNDNLDYYHTDRFYIVDPDETPAVRGYLGSSINALGRFRAFGGFSFTARWRRNTDISPVVGHTLMQVGQAWCRRALDKQGNTAVVRYVTLGDTSTTNPDGIRQNIRYLYLRMLGLEASDDDVEGLLQDVYIPLETQDTKTAWTGVCSSLIRHPLWLTR